MNVSARQRLVTSVVVGLVGVLAALVWWTFQEITVANVQRQQASEIARALSQLRLLTFEYRLYHSANVKARWFQVSEDVDRLIARAQASMPQFQTELSRMHARTAQERQIFSSIAPPGVLPPAESSPEPENRSNEARQLSLLVAAQQDTFSEVFRLTDVATARIDEAQRRMLSVTLTGLLLVAIIILAAAWFIRNKLLAPISRMQQATSDVGTGNPSVRFEPRGDDEVNQLGRSFNAMVERMEVQSHGLREARDDLEQRVRQRSRELQQLVAIVESSDVAIIGKTLDGVITSWNAGAQTLFGYAREEAVGQPLVMLFPPDRLDEEPRILERIARGELIDYFETVRIRKDGQRIEIAAKISPIKDAEGRVVGASKIARDITASRQAAQALQARDAAEAADRMKSEFLSNISHELRTPLNAIIGFTGTLLMQLPGAINADQEKQLKTVQASARHLLALINDLLDVAKIGAGKFEPRIEPVSCREVIEEVAAMLRPEAAHKGIAFQTLLPETDLTIQTDRRALYQIVLNLGNNAVKFTQQGSVQITLASQTHDGRHTVEIRVIDSGIGITAADQAKLFQPFVQVGTVAGRPAEGTGLGLHLSMKLAVALGGAISLCSEVGTGSTFTLSLSDS